MTSRNQSPNNPNSQNTKGSPAIAVIGSGYWGKNLIRNFYSLGALKLICDKNESILSGFKKQYNGIDTCLALADVLPRDDIDGWLLQLRQKHTST